MKTVNAKANEPKYDCFACLDGECQILTDTYCKRSKKCGHYQTKMQHDASVSKAKERLEKLGVDVSKYTGLQQKNNRVSGN